MEIIPSNSIAIWHKWKSNTQSSYGRFRFRHIEAHISHTLNFRIYTTNSRIRQLLRERVFTKMNLYENTAYDFVYLYNSGHECVPVYAGNENATNLNPDTFAIVIRFKSNMDTRLLAHLDMGQCVRINMVKNTPSFLQTISYGDYITTFRQKIHVTYSNKFEQGK